MVDVSVIVTAMTDAERRWLPEALHSVFSQTLRPKAIILMVEAENAWIGDLLAGISSEDRRQIEVYRTPLAPLGAIRNLAVAHCSTEWVAFIDGDDFWMPQKLERQAIAVLQHPGADFVGTDYVFVESEGKWFGFSNGSTPTPSSWMVKRSLMESHPFPPEARIGEDHTWLEDTRPVCKRIRVPELLVGYRIRGASLSSLQAKGTIQRRRREWAARIGRISIVRYLLMAATYPRYVLHKRNHYSI